MFIILNANPSFDRTIMMDKIPNYGVIRGKKVYKFPNGKGMNVARTLENIGYEKYICLNIFGRGVGEIIRNLGKSEGIKLETFWVKDESRVNTILVDRMGRTLVINEPGPILKKDEIDEFKRWFRKKLNDFQDGEDYLVISGSFPRGFERKDFIDILSTAKKLRYKVIVDISGEFLREALDQNVWLVKVSRNEIFKVSGENDIVNIMKNHKLQNIIVTDGIEGSDAFFMGSRMRAYPIEKEEKYAVGSGDAYLGGLIYGIAKGLPAIEILKIATACGGANTEKIGPCVFERDDFEKWLMKVKVDVIE